MLRLARCGLLVLALVPAWSAPARPAGLSGHLARVAAPFKQAACSAFALGSIADRCGYVVVPEDRSRPHGRLVQLALAVFTSRASHPAADPVIFLWGGPGDSVLTTLGAGIGPSLLQALGGTRDLILVDQRGTGLSRPSLACPEVSAALVATLDRRGGRSRADADILQAVQACRDRLVRAGVDLSAYTTLSDAADIAAIGPALGYRRVNLYGVSYGTRLALTILRLYPQHVRSVILDSVLPPQISLYVQALRGQGHILAVLLAACAADAACRTEYPRFDTALPAIVARLNAHPAALQVTLPPTGQVYRMALSGDLLWSLAFDLLSSSTENGSVFLMVAAAGRGNFDPARRAAAQRLAAYSDPAAYAAGLNLSDQCSEDAPSTTAAQIAAAGRTLPGALGAGAIADRLAALQQCRIWRVRAVPSRQKRAVRSSIPTLILTGEDDPITPPELGTLAARTLSRSFFYAFPGRGHVQAFGGDATCPASISAAFLRTPTRRPNASCIGSMPPLSFL